MDGNLSISRNYVWYADILKTHRPTMSSSLSEALRLIFGHMYMVNGVLALLNMDVSELMMAESITAINSPRRPV